MKKNSTFICLHSILFIFFNLFLFGDLRWDLYKERTLDEMSPISGWCSNEKAILMMDLIHKHKFQVCIEIGVFGGKSLFPIAKTLKYLGEGVVYGIDSWNKEIAVKEMDPSTQHYAWWNKIDYQEIYQKTVQLIQDNYLSDHSVLIKNNSTKALSNFQDETVDFIHIDGSCGEKQSLKDVQQALSKIRDRGYLLISDPNSWNKRECLVYLLERAEMISPFLPASTYYLFKKSKSKMRDADDLFK